MLNNLAELCQAILLMCTKYQSKIIKKNKNLLEKILMEYK